MCMINESCACLGSDYPPTWRGGSLGICMLVCKYNYRILQLFTASVPPAICLILVTYVGCNTTLAVVFLTLGTMFIGGMYPGFLSNHIDIAPNFAGILMGITNTFATIPGIVVPSFVGYMTHGNVSNILLIPKFLA